MSAHLPPGVLGLLLAALTGAAMTMLASDLNSLAMVLVEDFYRPARPASTDRQRLAAGRAIVAAVGVLNAGTALLLVQTRGSALAMWFAVSAIASGGLAGLFFLAFLAPRASRAGAWAGIACSTAFTIWAVLTRGAKPLLNLAPFNYPGDELTIGAVGNIILFGAGLLGSRLFPAAAAADRGTYWHWRRTRRERLANAPAGARQP